MVSDRIAKTVHLNHAIVHQHLFTVVIRNGDGDGLSCRNRTEGILSATKYQRCTIWYAIIGHVCRHVIDTGHLVGRMAQT